MIGIIYPLRPSCRGLRLELSRNCCKQHVVCSFVLEIKQHVVCSFVLEMFDLYQSLTNQPTKKIKKQKPTKDTILALYRALKRLDSEKIFMHEVTDEDAPMYVPVKTSLDTLLDISSVVFYVLL